MRAGEFVTELFRPGNQNWKWNRQSPDEAVANFTVGKRNYVWQAYNHHLDDKPETWEIQFRLIRDLFDPEKLSLFGTTGTGNSAEVMSIVVDIMREFLQDYGDNVQKIIFDAKENSRIALYTKMVKRLIPNWKLEQDYNPEMGLRFILSNPKQIDEAFRVSLDKLIPTRDSYDWNQMDPDVVDIFAKRAGTPEWDDKLGTLYVRPRPDGKYDIINGHHRYAGLKKAGVKHALVTLKNNDEDN
jgi:hypothetical protein